MDDQRHLSQIAYECTGIVQPWAITPSAMPSVTVRCSVHTSSPSRLSRLRWPDAGRGKEQTWPVKCWVTWTKGTKPYESLGPLQAYVGKSVIGNLPFSMIVSIWNKPTKNSLLAWSVYDMHPRLSQQFMVKSVCIIFEVLQQSFF